MTVRVFLVAAVLAALSCLPKSVRADTFTIAAASDLRFALDEVVDIFEQAHPDYDITVIYGSSGRMTNQISNGAPFDIFFSADIAFPEILQQQGLTATDPSVYAIGRIVLWSSRLDASEMTIADLTDERIRRIAIAQPAHAPYGQRAREALQAAGIWEQIQHKLVFGENIAHAAQMAESTMQAHPYHLIDDSEHQPLTQGFVITRYGAGKPGVEQFASFMATAAVHDIMKKYGFVLPGDAD